MAIKSEEQKDGLFGMSLGDGMIEIPDTPAETTEETTEEKKPKVETESTTYDDGSFEVHNETESASEETEENENDNEFIETNGKTKETPSKDDSSDSSSSPFLAFAKDRSDEGVFLEFTDEDWKELVERNEGDESAALKELSNISMQEMVKSGVDSFKESLSDEERNLYEAKEKGLPVDEYSTAKRNFDKYSKITEDSISDDVELQEDLVSKSLEIRGFSPEEITEEIEGYKALENLELKAKKALKIVPTAYKNKMVGLEEGAKSAEESRQNGIRQRVAKMKGLIEQTPEIIPGIKLNKTTREKIMKSMTVPVAKGKNGEPLNPVTATRAKNPEAFEMMIHYYHSLGLFDINDSGQMSPDFSKIAKVQKTKATDEMRSIFETKGKKVAGKPNVPAQSQDELDDFDKAFGRL